MLLNLSDVLKDEGKSERRSVPLELESYDSRLGNFPIIEKSPIEFVFSNISAEKARIEGSAELTFQACCDRCLKELPVRMELSIDRIVTSPEAEESDDIDDLGFMEGYQLNVETLLYNEIMENWPVKILCKEDCKGVCPRCGQDLNVKDCGCDTFVPDPRMAAIKDIFESYKEV